MSLYGDLVDSLFAGELDQDPSGALAEFAEVIAGARPSLLVWIAANSQEHVVWTPPEAALPEPARILTRAREAIALTPSGESSLETEEDPSWGLCRFVVGVDDRLVGWLRSKPSDNTPVMLQAARLTVAAVRRGRQLELEMGRVRHLQNEREVLHASHAVTVQELLEAKEREERQQRESLLRLELEVERRSAALRDALQQAETANAAKTAFLANMSHEIRTPMTAILGYVDLLPDAETTREELEEYTAIIRNNGQDLLRIVDTVLDFSRIEKGTMRIEPVEFAVRPFLEHLTERVRPVADEKGLRLSLHFGADTPDTIRTDPERLRQIMHSLLDNALKFTNAGRIEVRTVSIPDSAVETLRIEVEDSGIGISEEVLETIFSPFSQADDSTTRTFAGTGLGLALAKSLARMLGGELQAMSQVGVGSTFRVILRNR